MILKHRNRELLRFEWIESGGVRILSLAEANRKFLPLEFGEAVDKGREELLAERLLLWLNRRTAPMGRHFMRDLMASLGLNMRDPDFHRKALAFSKGLSLNDVHWVVPDGYGASWEECNLYSNEFSKSMAEIAFAGHGSRSPGEVTTSPEMTTNGMLPKCWRRVKGQVLLYKGGSETSLVAGVTRSLEPLELIQRFLQKRVDDILRYGENADKYITIIGKPVGVNSKVEKANVGVNADLDALSLQILWNMKADPFVTARVLADVLGVEQRTIERRIRALREKKVLKRIGEDKSGHWQVLV